MDKLSERERGQLGLVQVYTGNGKGKTTAALGLAVRATGNGFRVCFLQFMKGNRKCGEHLLAQRIAEQTAFFEMMCSNERSYFRQSVDQRLARAAETMAVARQVTSSGRYDLVVLDEVITAVGAGLLRPEEVLELINQKPNAVELVLTGRGAPQEIIDAADLVTEMVMVKHPYKTGVKARKGIEY